MSDSGVLTPEELMAILDAGSTKDDEELASNAPFSVSIQGARDALPVDAPADPAPLLDASTESATTDTPARDATAEEAEFRIPICPPLPLELRALVARFASIHDAEHKVRWAKGERGADLVSKVIRKWDGRALIALSETDRAFNLASHPYIFQEITGKQASSQLFGPVFAPKFGSHIRSLSLLHQGTAAMGAISAFLVLPRLQKLSLSLAAANSLLGPSGLAADAVGNNHDHYATSSIPASVGRLAFRQRVRNITELVLNDFARVQDGLADILACFPNLLSLRLSSNQFDTSLPRQLLNLSPHLHHLEIDGQEHCYFDPSWATAEGWPTHIKSLSLVKFAPGASLFKFINLFAPTLQTLNITLIRSSTPTSFSFATETFPVLRTLSFDFALPALAADLITSFANPTSVLEEIRVGLGKTLPGELTVVLKALELHSSTLLRTRVAYSGLGHGGPYTRPKLPENVHLHYVPPPDMFWSRRPVEAIEASSEEHQTFAAKQWAECLREVLGETHDQIWDLQEAKDFKEMDKLFKTLATFRVRSLMTLPSV